MSTQTQKEWKKNANSDFENWNNYDMLPEEFKKYIRPEVGFKTTQEQEEALAQFTSGKKYIYGVNENKWAMENIGQQVLSVWRVPSNRGQGGSGSYSGGGSSSSSSAGSGKPQYPPSMHVDLEVLDVDRAKIVLEQNNDRRSISDPIWEYKDSYVLRKEDGSDELVHILLRKKRFSISQWSSSSSAGGSSSG